jgi:hypothetical protein
MKTSLALSVLLLAMVLTSAGSIRALAYRLRPMPGQAASGDSKKLQGTGDRTNALTTAGKPAAQSASQLPETAGGPQTHASQSPKSSAIWTQGIPGAIVSILAAIGSLYYFYKNRDLSRDIADRTVTFEAQKLLVEINKQFIADPSLFAIYDDNLENKKALENDPKLKAKVDALGYMKLNVYEIVFSKLPDDPREGSWRAYFIDSLDRCSVLAEELKVSRGIYDPKLLKAYDDWVEDVPGRERRAAVRKEKSLGSKAAWIESTQSGPHPRVESQTETLKGPNI